MYLTKEDIYLRLNNKIDKRCNRQALVNALFFVVQKESIDFSRYDIVRTNGYLYKDVLYNPKRKKSRFEFDLFKVYNLLLNRYALELESIYNENVSRET